MAAEPILVALADILHLSRQMLADAKAGSWPEFLALNERRQEKIDWLMTQSWPADDWSPNERDRGAVSLTELLRYNTDIGKLAVDWHAELRTILTQARISSRISNTYAGNAK